MVKHKDGKMYGWMKMFLGAGLMLCGFVWKYYGPEMAIVAGGALIFAKGFFLTYVKK